MIKAQKYSPLGSQDTRKEEFLKTMRQEGIPARVFDLKKQKRISVSRWKELFV